MYQENLLALDTSTLGKRLSSILEEKGITVYRLATDAKLDKMTLSNYVNDKVKRPNDLIIDAISKYLDVSKEWLKSGTGERERSKSDVLGEKPQRYPEAIPVNFKEMNVQYAPLVSYYAYGGYMSGFGDPEYLESLPKLPFAGEVEYKGEYMWFEVKGDSMEAFVIEDMRDAIFERDMVLGRNIRKDLWHSRLHMHKWKNFVIVHNTDGIIVKQIVSHDVANGTITIHSLNPMYKDREIDLRDVAQIFNVVEIRRR